MNRVAVRCGLSVVFGLQLGGLGHAFQLGQLPKDPKGPIDLVNGVGIHPGDPDPVEIDVLAEAVVLVAATAGNAFAMVADNYDDKTKVLFTDVDDLNDDCATVVARTCAAGANYTVANSGTPPDGTKPPNTTIFTLQDPNVCSVDSGIDFTGVILQDDPDQPTYSYLGLHEDMQEGDDDPLPVRKGLGLSQNQGFVDGGAMACSYESCPNSDIHVYVFSLVDPDDGTGRKAMLTRRVGSGATAQDFETPIPFGMDVEDLGLAVTNQLCLSWLERGGNGGDLMSAGRMLCDITTTATFPVKVADNVREFEGDCEGDRVEYAFKDRPVGMGDRLLSATSINGGASFSAGVVVGNYNPTTDSVGDFTTAIVPATSTILLAWVDDRFGFDFVFSAVSQDAGANWAETPLGPGDDPGLVVGSDGEVSVYWVSDAASAKLLTKLSPDGGLSWADAVVVDGGGDVSDPIGLYQETYDRFAFFWLADNGGVRSPFAGGFRPQTLTPVNWTVGASNPGFRFTRFDNSDDQFAIALLSTALTPDFLIVDGIDLGVIFDPVVSASFLVVPDGNGDGAISVPGPIPPTVAGGTLFAVGVGFNPVGPEIGSVTSPVTIQL